MLVKTIHRTDIRATCPTGCPDYYRAEFHTGARIIRVEDIVEAVRELTREPILQEQLTDAMANRLGCQVITTGMHGQFESTSVAEPNPVAA